MIFNTQIAGGSSIITGGITQDSNGFLVLDPNGSGGGGSGGTWSWMGKNPVKVKTYTKEKVYFKDTDFPDWTWSTSQSTLIAGTDYSESETFDLTQYAYIIIFKFHTHIDYGNWNPTSAVIDYSFCGGGSYYAGYNAVANIQSETYTTMRSGQDAISYSYCKNNNGVDTLFSNSYCGLYANSTPGMSASGYLSAEAVTLKRPTIYVKGSTTYFSETAFQNVDTDNSYYEYLFEIWRVDLITANKQVFDQAAVDIIVNGLD